MENENFYRRYLLSCGKMGDNGFQIGNIDSAKQEALHVSFSVEKSDAESANTAKVQIWNLSNTNLKILETKDIVVELKAGYGDNVALILAGNVTAATTTPDGADRLTELEVVDGRVELRDTNISVSLNGKVNTKAVYQYIADKMGLSIVFAKDLAFKTLPHGYSYVGKGRNALQRVASANGHAWSIQNGVIQVTWPGRPINTQGYLLNSDTGLIGIPKRITIQQNGSTETLSGWEIEYLLNGAIGVNDVIQLQSNTANGYFRVYKITIDGDNLEGDWSCVAQVLQILALPKLDVKAEAAATSSTKTASNSKASSGSSSSSGSSAFKKGDKVRVRNGAKNYTGTTSLASFVYSTVYTVIQVGGTGLPSDRIVIGINGAVTAAVKATDLYRA